MTTITAKVITDSISKFDDRLITILLKYPYNIQNQLSQYKIFQNSIYKKKSNTDLKTLIENIDNDIALPIKFKKNTDIELTKSLETSCIYAIKELWNHTKSCLEVFAAEELNINTISNYLYPFQHIEVLVTSSNWWDELLICEHEQPEINELISQIRQAINKSNPILKREDEWHLPFIYCEEDSYRLDNAQLSLDQAKKCSVSRCLNLGTNEKNLIEDDIQLCNHNKCLIALEHIARPLSTQEVNDNIELMNFIKKRKIMWNNPIQNGWVTYRQELGKS